MDWLEKIIDDTLDKMAKDAILMHNPDPNMPNEMFDSTSESDSDWKVWKPIPSVLNDSDLNELEKMIGTELPLSYRHFLKYKHFYKLDIPDFSVNFPPHLPDKNLDRFKRWFFEYNEFPIVFIDHEDLRTTHQYSKDFKGLMTADRERGNRFVIELNEYYR